MQEAYSKEEFEAKLRDMGRMYHIHHPFHIRMYEGTCTKRRDSRLGLQIDFIINV